MNIGYVCKDYVEIINFVNYIKNNLNANFFDLTEYKANDLDLIISFGGDGTALRCVEYALKCDCPILAVNTGNLGFLCAYESSNIDKLLNDIKNNTYNYQLRDILQLKLDGRFFYALNDVIIERNHSNRCETNTFQLVINNEVAQVIDSDGYVIATPTGSTAYSLSAGGAILHPSSKAFIATPICSHSSKCSSIVYPNDFTTKIQLKRANAPANIYCDSDFKGILKVDETLEVILHHKQLKTVKSDDFFAVLNNKLQAWSKRG